MVALPELDAAAIAAPSDGAVWGRGCLSEVILCSLSLIAISLLSFLLLISALKPTVPRHVRNATMPLVQLSHVFCWFPSHKVSSGSGGGLRDVSLEFQSVIALVSVLIL